MSDGCELVGLQDIKDFVSGKSQKKFNTLCFKSLTFVNIILWKILETAGCPGYTRDRICINNSAFSEFCQSK